LTKEKLIMSEQTTVQKLKAERVQEPLALMRKRVLGKDDPVGAAMAVTRNQAEERLKAERVQLRLKRMRGWKMVGDGKAIDRLRTFESPLVAAAYLAFASLVARQAGQPLRVSMADGNIVLALTGRAKGSDKGLTEAVLDLAEQLG
jgi:pterin-4a-carbinolamine dehydratase